MPILTNGPMENLLEGLDDSSDVLTTEELRLELAARGIDADAVTAKIQAIIAKHKTAKSERAAQRADFADKVYAASEPVHVPGEIAEGGK